MCLKKTKSLINAPNFACKENASMLICVKKNKTECKTLIRNKKYIGIKCKEDVKNKGKNRSRKSEVGCQKLKTRQ